MLRAIFTMIIVRGITLFFPLISIPLIIKLLGLSGYGNYMVIFALSSLYATCVNYGFDYTASRDISRTNNSSELNRLFSVFINCKLIIFVATSLFSFGIFLFRDDGVLSYIGILIFIFSQVLTPIYLFQGMRKMSYLIYNTIFLNICNVASIIVLIIFNSSVSFSELFLIYAIINFFASILMCSYIKRILNVSYVKVSFKDSVEKIKSGFLIFFSRIISMGLSQISIVILSLVLSPNALGMYAIGDRLIRAANSIFYAIQQATYPYFCAKKDIKNKFLTLLLSLVTIAVIGAVIIDCSSMLLEQYIFKVSGVSDVFSLLAWVLIPMAISGMLGVNYLLANDKNFLFTMILAVGSLLNIGLMYYLGKLYSWRGAGFAMLFTESVIAILMILSYAYYNSNRYRGA